MAAAYLVGIGLVTAGGIVVAAGDGCGRVRPRRLLGLLALWAALVGAGWPLSRLTFDLAFVFASNLTLLLAVVAWLATGRRRAASSSPLEGGR